MLPVFITALQGNTDRMWMDIYYMYKYVQGFISMNCLVQLWKVANPKSGWWTCRPATQLRASVAVQV